MKGQTTISNVEYHHLFQEGGDALIAFFATLRYHKGGDIVFHKQGRKGTPATIRHYTGLSLTTIKEYLPRLVELGLVAVQSNGNIVVRGRNWTRKNLPEKSKYKLLPIQVHKKFTNTKWSSYSVRVHSNLKLQERAIEKKSERIKQLKHLQEGTIQGLKQYKTAKRLSRRFDLDQLENSHRSTATISNKRFAQLRNPNLSPYSGQYGKHKLIKLGHIKQERRFELLDSNNSFAHLQYYKQVLGIHNAYACQYGIYREVSPDILAVRCLC